MQYPKISCQKKKFWQQVEWEKYVDTDLPQNFFEQARFFIGIL